MGRFRQSADKLVWTAAAALGLILFALIQVLPIAGRYFAEDARLLSRDAAKSAALTIAQERFGISADKDEIVLIHMSDSAAVGYFTKEKLIDVYSDTWFNSYPTDVYQAELPISEGGGKLTLFLHMTTGELLGFRDSRSLLHTGDGSENQMSLSHLALEYAAQWGEDPDKWEWDGAPADAAGGFVFLLREEKIGEARIHLKVHVPPGYDPASSVLPPWAYGSVEYEIKIPAQFAVYMAKQERMASKMNMLGFILPQLVLIVLAIAYASHLRKYTSFRRGSLLALIFFVLYGIFYLNMMPGFWAGLLEDGAEISRETLSAVMTVNFIILACLALFTYFSAVAGDGLWRAMGRQLWPRWQDPDFGRAVLDGMKQGYMLAFILLGVQSVIFLGLKIGIGMFQSSDAAQSPANLTVSGLLILLAWCAGISEELQSRLFGIGLFRSWFVNGAKHVLRRPLSPRGENILTVAAMLPPGIIWAFGHVSYAVYPAYSRLIELVIMALLFGWFMLRFGIIAVMFAHVILNSTLMSVQLIFDGLPGDNGFAIAGLLLPAAIAFVLAFARRKWGNSGPAAEQI